MVCATSLASAYMLNRIHASFMDWVRSIEEYKDISGLLVLCNWIRTIF